MLSPDRARALLSEVRGVVREAGALARPAFREGQRTTARSWVKAGDSPVTEADLAVDAFLKERLGALLPEAGWLSEETADDPSRLGRPLVWIVDPIDGTRAFAAGNPDWCVSVALVAGERPLLGVVYAPIPDQLYEALEGGGARRDDAVIAVSAREDLAAARAAGPKPMLDRLEAACGVATTRLPKISSLALRIVRVADGTIDLGLAGGNSHDWDLAGADLVLQEAGGRLADARGSVPLYNRPEPWHGELVAASRRLCGPACATLAG